MEAARQLIECNCILVQQDRTHTAQETSELVAVMVNAMTRAGVRPGVCVAICIERSAEAVITMLAVKQIGAAYLPLDPQHPDSRLQYMLDDSESALLITHSRVKNHLEFSGGPVWQFDVEESWIGQLRDNPIVVPEDSMYILYTSGSTGKPKGVICRWEAVQNMLYGFQDCAPLEYGDRCMSWCNLSWDVSIYDIYQAANFTGYLYFVPADIHADGPALMQWIYDNKIAAGYIPPMMVVDLLEWCRAHPGQCTLKQLFLAVEPIPLAFMREIESLSLQLRIINGYGPTETTVATTLYAVADDDSEDYPGRRAPLGKPIRNITHYVVNDNLDLLPDGETGELLIGGVGVAHGFLKRPELTVEKFIKDPFSDDPNERVYKSGDLVKRLPDGNYEFVGRSDGQFKLMGVRIESGEIGSVIAEHPSVREVVVKPVEVKGLKRLTAYICLVAGADAIAVRQECRNLCAKALIPVMQPVYYVVLERMPMTEHGKVDRPALPVPVESDLVTQTIVPARDDWDERILDIYTQLLGGMPMGIDHNFFAMGGNSLLAATLAHRISISLDLEVKLQHVMNHPTVRGLADALRDMNVQSALPPVPVAENQILAPLSNSQQREWFLCQLSPENPAFHIVFAWELTGEFDALRMHRAVNAVVQAQPSMRTQFRMQNDNVVQEVVSDAEVLMQHYQADNWEHAHEIAHTLVLEPFYLGVAHLLRTYVISVTPDQCLFMIVMHHIISDGWSMGLLVNDLNNLYSNDKAEATTPVRTYIDYSHWQQLPETRQVWQLQQQYWSRQLESVPSLLPLPIDHARPALASETAGNVHLKIPDELRKRLVELASARNSTVYSVLLSTLFYMLHRLSGERDICVGTFCANRERAELEKTMGFFINTLVMRSSIQEDDSFSSLLERVAKTGNDALDNGGVPFEHVMNAVKIERSLAYSPIFQVMFVYQNVDQGVLELPGIRSNWHYVGTERSLFDLTWWVTPRPDGIELVLDYRKDILDHSTAERWAQMWVHALEQIVIQPDEPLDALPCHSEDEAATLQLYGCPIDSDLQIEPKAVPQLILDRLLVQPDMPAIHWWDEVDLRSCTWSRAELSSYANNVAAALKGQTQPVGVCVNRSPELVGCLLGVMLAGCPVVALDSTYPDDRLQHIVADSGMGCILYNSLTAELSKRLGDGLKLLDLDTELIAAAPSEWHVEWEAPAVMIYTSGSTGTPRGVEISHRSLSHFVQRAIKGYGITENDVVLQFSSPNFDASMEEIYPCLLAGGVLVLRTPETANDAMELQRLLSEWGVTVLDLPTAYFSVAVASAAAPALPESVRMVIIGGEKALSNHVTSFVDRYPDITLFNTYGPTECTVVCSMVVLNRALLEEHDGEAPIGRPCFGAIARVVEPSGSLAPFGAVGELWIGGEGVAIGYRNRPEMTQQRFVTDSSGQRFYRTGDLVRWRANGHLEYIGRADRQVKLHGYRVEPAEIEEACCQVPGVRQAVVVAVGDAANKQLVAYLAAETDATEVMVREYLEIKLPRYMVPAVIMLLPELPMTPGGKLDSNALPDVIVSKEHHLVPPSNHLEEVLCEVWKQLFNREVGIDDDFFELGGFSLMIMDMIVRASHYGVAITPAQVIRSGTIRRLADALSDIHREEILVQLSHGEGTPLFIVHSTPGDVMGYAHLASIIGAVRPVYGLESLGLTDPDNAHTTVEQMASAYIQAMKRVQPQGPYDIAGWCYGGMVASEMAIQLQDAGEKLGSVILIETPTSDAGKSSIVVKLQRVYALLRLGPKGVYNWYMGKVRYLRSVASGEMERGFHLDLNSGILKNRGIVSKLNLQASFAYRQKRHPGNIHLIYGDTLADGAIPDADWGWKSKTAIVTHDVVPGTHETILKPPNAAKLAEVMLQYLPRTTHSDG